MGLPDPWENSELFDLLVLSKRCEMIMRDWQHHKKRYVDDEITRLVQMANLIMETINLQMGRTDGPSGYEVFATQQSVQGYLEVDGSQQLSSSTAIVPAGDNAETIAKLYLLWQLIYRMIWKPTPDLAVWLADVFEQIHDASSNASSLEEVTCLVLPAPIIMQREGEE